MYSLAGRTILITGASDGIGREMALQLGERARLLVLVARDGAKLRDLAAGLRAETRVIPCDLAVRGAVDELARELGDLAIDVLINNAAVGLGDSFVAGEEDRLSRLIELNVVTPTLLCRRLLPPMLARGHGAVLNVGSTAGFQPVPYMLVYAATKAYMNHFTRGLARELRGTGVGVTLFAPGTTRTRFFESAGMKAARVERIGQAAAPVAAAGLLALEKGRAVMIPGIHNRLLALAQKLAPQALAVAVAARVFRPRK